MTFNQLLYSMRRLVAAASISLCGCASQASVKTHSDFSRAMATWAASGVESYSYGVEYFRHGCQIIDAKVYVMAGNVIHQLRKNDESRCAKEWTGEPGKLAARKIAGLFAEIIFFQQGGVIDFPPPVFLSFDSKLGYPRQLRLLTNVDRKILSISLDSDIPLDYEYRLSSFEVLANDT